MNKKIFFLIFALVILSNIALSMESDNYNGTSGVSYLSSNASSQNNTLRISGSIITSKSDTANFHQRISLIGNNFLDIYPPEIDADLVNLSLSQNSDGSILLTWNNDTNYDIKKYNVYRSNDTILTPLDASLRYASNITSLSWSDTGINADTSYFYAITAVDDAGNENLSATSYNQNITVFSSCQNSFSSWVENQCSRRRARTCYISVNDEDAETESKDCTSSAINQSNAVIRESLMILNVKAGESREMIFQIIELSIAKITASFTKDLASYKITIEKISKIPKELASEDEAYVILQISPSDANGTVSSAEIEFKVKKEWIESRDREKTDIKMYRFTDKWVELNTAISGSDDYYIYYKAETPGFSYFKVAFRKKETKPNEANQITGEAVAPMTEEPAIIEQIPPKSSNQTLQNKEDNTNKSIFTFILLGIILSAALITVYNKRPYKRTYYEAAKPSKKELMVLKLTEYLLKNHEDFKNHAFLKQALISKGWNAEIVEKAVNNLPLHKIIDEKAFELSEYLKEHHLDMVDHKIIKNDLIKKGWGAEVVKKTIISLPAHTETEKKAFALAKHLKSNHLELIDHDRLKDSLINKGWEKDFTDKVISYM